MLPIRIDCSRSRWMKQENKEGTSLNTLLVDALSNINAYILYFMTFFIWIYSFISVHRVNLVEQLDILLTLLLPVRWEDWHHC